MDIGTTATFALAFLVSAASPGPDDIAVLSKTVDDGPARGVAYGCGVVARIVRFVAVAAPGLGALAGADALVLLAVVVAVEALVIGAHVALAPRAKAALARPRRIRALNRGTGGSSRPADRVEPDELFRQPGVDDSPLSGAPMPLYYIDVYDNDRLARDEFGLELDSLYEAREQAIALLPDMARHGLPDGDSHDFRAVVRCTGGRVRYEATLSLRGGWVEAPTYPPLTRH